MKMRLFIIIFGALLLLYAGLPPTLVQADTTPLSKGIDAFYNQDYEAAYDHLLKAFDQYPENIELNFYLGRAAFESGNYEMAVMAYERILIASPHELRVKLEIARAFHQLGSNNMARKYCREVLAADPPANVKQNILVFLNAIDKAEQTHFVTGQLTAGYDWNNNVWASPSNRTIDTVIGDVDLTGASAVRTQDTVYSVTLGLNHQYRPMYSRQSWKTQAIIYQGYYGKTSDLDTVYTFGQTGPVFTFKNDRLEIGISAAQVQLDNDKYAADIGLQGKWEHIVNPGVVLTAVADLKEHQYPTISGKDSIEKSVGVEAGFIKGATSFTLGGKITRESAFDDEYSHYKYSGYSAISRELLEDLVASVSYEYQYSGYDQPAVLFGRERRDELHFAGCGIRKKLWQKSDSAIQSIFFNINYSHVWANSNIPLYDYKKDLVQLSLSYYF